MQLDRQYVYWSPEHIEFVRQCYVAERSFAEIIDGLQENFGLTVGQRQVETIIRRHCKAEVEARREKEERTREALAEEARKLIAQGKTPSEVAKQIGVEVKRVRRWIGSWRRVRPTFGFKKWLEKQRRESVPEDPIIDHGFLITELRHGDCRWPIGKDTDGLFRFCGCQRSSITSQYCTTHAVKAVKSGKLKVEITDETAEPVPVPVNVMVTEEVFETEERLAA